MTDNEEPLPFALDDWDDPWPVTPRTRFMIWRALTVLHFSLQLDLDAWPDRSRVTAINDYPAFTRGQSKEWWIETQKAVERMGERMRTGVEWNPRTPAEEAALLLACEEEWIAAAHDDVRDMGLKAAFDDLPDHGDLDYQYEEALGALIGDTDIEMIFDPSYDGLGDPEDAINAAHGIGDYRPRAWHRMFDRYQREPDWPSSLH